MFRVSCTISKNRGRHCSIQQIKEELKLILYIKGGNTICPKSYKINEQRILDLVQPYKDKMNKKYKIKEEGKDLHVNITNEAQLFFYRYEMLNLLKSKT